MSSVTNTCTSPPNVARQAPELDLLFAPHTSGYVGADVGLSIPLPDGRVLWVFGDTLIGICSDGDRSWNAMPKNTIAIQPSALPEAGTMEWCLVDRDGNTQTFFRLPKNADGEWFWPGTGCVLNNELFLFGYGVVAAESECEALSFRVVRGWLFRVADITGKPADWQYTCAPTEWRVGCIFSSACIADGDYLYVMGIALRESRPHRQSDAFLSRVRVAELIKSGAKASPEFWCAGEIWSPDRHTELLPLFHPGVTECSFYFDAPRNRYISTTYTGREPELLVSHSTSLTGRWSAPVCIYRCAEVQPADDYLFYTFRMHPQLAANADEMVMSYVVNARTPADLESNTAIYYPRFIRVDLREI